MTATKTPATVIPAPKHSTDYVTAWRAQSRTHAGVTYVVTYDRLGNDWRCQCPAYTYRGHCQHIEAAIEAQVATWREKLQEGKQ
jgi:hypothetical protein